MSWGPTQTIGHSTLDVVAGADRPHRGELKNLLKEQPFVAGIGNGYSDEDSVGGPTGALPEAVDARGG